MVMNIPVAMSNWTVYEAMRRSLVGEGSAVDENSLVFVVAGSVAGTCAAITATPLDVIKTKIQLGGTGVSGFKDALRQVHADAQLCRCGVVRAFFKGCGPRIIYSAPATAVTMTTYELTKRFLGMNEVPS